MGITVGEVLGGIATWFSAQDLGKVLVAGALIWLCCYVFLELCKWLTGKV